MPSHRLTASESLPRSHYFLTVSRGSAMRTVAIRAILTHIVLAVVPLLSIVGLGSTLYVVFHDDLVADLMRRQSAQQYAYEERIEGLQQELERQKSQARSDEKALGSRLQDLYARQARLEGRAAVVADLAAEVGSPLRRPEPAGRRPELPVAITGSVAPPPVAALGYAAPPKPHPIIEPATEGPVPGALPTHEDHAALPESEDLPLAVRLSAADRSLDRLETAQGDTMARLGTTAQRRATRIRGLIEEAGLSPERFMPRSTASGVGGPFVPLSDGPDGGFNRAVADLRVAVSAAAQLGSTLPRLPFGAPLLGRMEVTSPFGPRTDPFLGRPALHSGVDLREGFGTEIRATGGGRVVFAGVAGGYGNMVEVDHGNGLTTRFGHMGGFAVSEGQMVIRGTVLGYVGATGRATGPHLHYEVRIDGEPVDPTRFLAVADHLSEVASR